MEKRTHKLFWVYVFCCKLKPVTGFGLTVSKCAAEYAIVAYLLYAHMRSSLFTLPKTFEPLIYISIDIYGMHCGKVVIFKNVPGRKKNH